MSNLVHNAVFYTHADWAWMGSLGVALFLRWQYGRPVVSYPTGWFNLDPDGDPVHDEYQEPH